ncbi:hypothetical protein EOS93_23205 [Rhizobium sp. RMa-01]|uniref:hypothetical protein n=1 Tax=unclassified Rhizobium TaxID=2613769 RepID=UPI0008D9D461|nr:MULTISPECIES: hypothetical protein [unclassified Rhizobium]OHV21422.1 hypothetical protein BBJ66_31160 [Rhizobium sp. RSm-3]RVU08821.1 hypothetical protein EOS93_23205 [Rhizobium sp. RMa-01]
MRILKPTMMTKEAALLLHTLEIKQAKAVCFDLKDWETVPKGLWAERLLHPEYFVRQFIHDICQSESRLDLLEVDSIVFRAGSVVELLDAKGKRLKLRQFDLQWINGALRYQDVPVYAVRGDGLSIVQHTPAIIVSDDLRGQILRSKADCEAALQNLMAPPSDPSIVWQQ